MVCHLREAPKDDSARGDAADVVLHERVHAFARLKLMHAIGQAAHPLVQVVDFLVASVQATLQIEDAR